MSKWLTVSVAAYNVEQYIDKTLSSCVVPLKVREKLEIIVVNDGSVDGTEEIIQRYVRKYPELFVYINKKNGGYGSTINAAVKIAKGKYFRLLDGDDYFDKEALCDFIEKLRQTDADLVLNDFSVCYEKHKRVEKEFLELDDDRDIDIVNLNLNKTIAMYSFCYKTEILKRNNIQIDENCFYTDIEYIMRPLRYIRNYRYIQNNLYQYRIGIEGQSVSRSGMKRHCNDAQKVTYAVLKELRMGYKFDSIYNIVETLACMMVKMTIKSMMCREASNVNRNRIIQFDKTIQKEFPQIYLYTGKSCVLSVLRKTHYWTYPLWRLVKK